MTRFCTLTIAAALLVLAAACKTENSAQAQTPTPKKKMVYIPPQTGSLVGRWVAVDEVTNQSPSSVQVGAGDALSEAQRRANAHAPRPAGGR